MSSTDCNKWVDATKNASCVACTLGPLTSVTWAPILYADDGAELFYNVGGCIALADPSKLTCAEAFEYGTECALAACQAACPVPTGPDNAFSRCVGQADGDGGACETYASKVATCTAALAPDASTSPASFCLELDSTDPDYLLRYLTLACGYAASDDAGPPADAGSGTPHDGGSRDGH
jgi:hypothetical protein